MLPYGRQSITDADLQAVEEALCSDFLTTGPRIEHFEQAFAEKLGADFAVACCNGTAALHLAAMAADLGPGDWSIVPSQTFLATANAVQFCGADVWFADVGPDSGLLRESDFQVALEGAGRRNIKAVFPVHLNGHMVPVEALAKRARDQGLWVIEDACHALGTQYQTHDGSIAQVGDCRFSDMTVFSLHPVKTMTSGEGGVVTTNNAALAARMRELRNHGMTREPARFSNERDALDSQGNPNPWYYEMQHLGYNFRITDFQCALGFSQLQRLDSFFARRRELRKLYDSQLSNFRNGLQPIAENPQVDPVLHLYAVLIDFQGLGIDRAEIMSHLREAGIGTQVHYYPVHQQPYYRGRYGDINLPGARAYYDRVLSLPFFPGMENFDVAAVVQALEYLLSKKVQSAL